MSAQIRPVENKTDEIDATEAAIRRVANELHRLNNAVMQAVDAGVSVELIRSSRHHSGTGNWGDLLVPVITRRNDS